MEQIKTPYGLEDHLDAVCQQAPQFKDLVSSWVLNKRSCATALKQVAQNYPHYSVHDELHAKNVISTMEQILGEDRMRMYTMMQVCRETDMTYQALKFYCNEGLVPNVKRDKNNRRVFDEHSLQWIKSLICLKKCGISIQEMEAYLDLCLKGKVPSPSGPM